MRFKVINILLEKYDCNIVQWLKHLPKHTRIVLYLLYVIIWVVILWQPYGTHTLYTCFGVLSKTLPSIFHQGTEKIPFSLSQIDDLGKLDLSHNSFSGRIPSGRHFDGCSFEGNNDLCGEQVKKRCPGDGDERRVKDGEGEAINGDEENGFYEALYMSMGIGYFSGFWGLLGPILVCRSSGNAYLRFLHRVTSRIYDQLYWMPQEKRYICIFSFSIPPFISCLT